MANITPMEDNQYENRGEQSLAVKSMDFGSWRALHQVQALPPTAVPVTLSVTEPLCASASFRCRYNSVYSIGLL